MDIFNSSEYKRSRKAYVTQCTLEHLIVILVGDAFLAKLLSHLGLSDAMVGIITTFASVAFVFQLLSILLVQSKMSTKKIVIISDVISQGSFMLAFFVPLMPIPSIARKFLVMVAVMTGHAAKCLILTLYFKWGNTYVPEDNRAVFSANKECVSLICGIAMSAIMGYIIDKFEGIGNITGGFLFIAVTMLIINVANFISLMMIKDESYEARESMRVKTSEVIEHIFSNKLFLRFTLIGFISATAGGMIGGFVGIYKIKDLAMSIFLVNVINILADFLRMGVSRPFARYSQKYGYIRGLQLAEIMIAVCYALIIFTTPKTWWLVIPYTLLTAVSAAGSYQNSFNIAYTLLPQKYMAQAMAIRRTAVAIVQFISALIAGKVLSIIQTNGNMIFGIHIYAQQFLACIALPLYIIMIVLQQKIVIEPLEKRRSEDVEEKIV